MQIPSGYSWLIPSVAPIAIRMKSKLLNCDKGLMIWFWFLIIFGSSAFDPLSYVWDSLPASHFGAEHATCLLFRLPCSCKSGTANYMLLNSEASAGKIRRLRGTLCGGLVVTSLSFWANRGSDTSVGSCAQCSGPAVTVRHMVTLSTQMRWQSVFSPDHFWV